IPARWSRPSRVPLHGFPADVLTAQFAAGGLHGGTRADGWLIAAPADLRAGQRLSRPGCAPECTPEMMSRSRPPGYTDSPPSDVTAPAPGRPPERSRILAPRRLLRQSCSVIGLVASWHQPDGPVGSGARDHFCRDSPPPAAGMACSMPRDARPALMCG